MDRDVWLRMTTLTRSLQDPISNCEANDMLPQCSTDATPDELAMLVGENWLLSSLIVWILDQLNHQPQFTIGLCLNLATLNDLNSLSRKRSLVPVQNKAFLLNIGRNSDGTVFIADTTRSGCHLSLVYVDISDRCHATVLYCDTLGWDCPQRLLHVVEPFTQFLGCNALSPLFFSSAHTPTEHGYKHKCSV